MLIATIKQKTALYLGNKTYAPQKTCVDAGAGEGAAAAVHDRLVTLTCARQQTNTPNTHITLLQFTGAVCMQCIFCRALWDVRLSECGDTACEVGKQGHRGQNGKDQGSQATGCYSPQLCGRDSNRGGRDCNDGYRGPSSCDNYGHPIKLSAAL